MSWKNGLRGTVALLPLLLWMPGAHAAGNTALAGNWARDDGQIRMVISPCGGNFCATNTFVKDPQGKEKVGDELILKLSPVSESVLQGQAYDVRRKMNYKMTITLQGANMHTSGCVLMGMICKAAGWTKAN